jgi:hypothetical protein
MLSNLGENPSPSSIWLASCSDKHLEKGLAWHTKRATILALHDVKHTLPYYNSVRAIAKLKSHLEKRKLNNAKILKCMGGCKKNESFDRIFNLIAHKENEQ